VSWVLLAVDLFLVASLMYVTHTYRRIIRRQNEELARLVKQRKEGVS
jgi:hypothetical protein